MVEKIRSLLAEKEHLKHYPIGIEVSEDGVATLRGQVDVWQHVVDIGHLVGSLPEVASVVNDIGVKGLHIPEPDYSAEIAEAKRRGVLCTTDVLVIGAGISGCAVARALCKYKLDVAVTDMHCDVSMGASGANSGAIHPGHMVKPGTLKARLNVKGNDMYTQWQEELGFRMIRRGSLGVAYDEHDGKVLEYIHAVAQKNGVPGCRMISEEEMREIEPNVPGTPKVILRNETMGTVEPYEVVVALANNAAMNGVKFFLGNPVYALEIQGDRDFTVVTKQGMIKARYVINAAGIHADDVAGMAGDKFYTLHARRGVIVVYDKKVPYPYRVGVGTVSRNATAESKGGGCGKTPEGNVQAGPSATETPYKDDTATYPEDFVYTMERGKSVIPSLTPGDAITYFTGVRPADYKEDFIIKMSEKAPGFVHVAAIQSPGLASAPAVAEMVEEILLEDMQAQGKAPEADPGYQPRLVPKKEFRHLSRSEQDEMIRKDPKYGRVVCRCETITEGEILEAVRSPVVPTSVDAIKRRTRAGMGRCQGGFCQPRVVELLARELGKDWVDINLKDEGSYILHEKTREEGDVHKEVSGR